MKASKYMCRITHLLYEDRLQHLKITNIKLQKNLWWHDWII